MKIITVLATHISYRYLEGVAIIVIVTVIVIVIVIVIAIESEGHSKGQQQLWGMQNHYRPCKDSYLQISRGRSNRGQHRDDEYQILSSCPQVCTQPLM